jgi:hypothetical protein
MNKINLKEKIEVLNMHRITFVVVLFILLIVIVSILLLIWWPTKPSLAEITNSWVALIMVYLVLSILLFAKPIYKFFEEFISAKKSEQHDSQKSRQEQFLGLISDINVGDLASYYDSKQDNILNKERLHKSKSVNREEFDNIWQPKISDPEEREAIQDALLDLEFIREEEGDTFSITRLGSAYVNYLKEMDKQII